LLSARPGVVGETAVDVIAARHSFELTAGPVVVTGRAPKAANEGCDRAVWA
jgi:hypothetical protein